MIPCYGCKELVDVEICTSWVGSSPVCTECLTQCIKEIGTDLEGNVQDWD